MAIAVIGADRPGIVAAATRALADRGSNLADVAMTILSGHFAMVLVCEASGLAAADLAAALQAELPADLVVAAWDLEPHRRPAEANLVLTAYGRDRTGIVSAVTGAVAALGVNITGMSCRAGGDGTYIVTMDLSSPVDAGELENAVGAAAGPLGLQYSIHPVEVDVL